MSAKGRPKGTRYDFFIDLIADIIVQADGQKTFNQAFREVLNSHTSGVEDETARRHLQKRWKAEEQQMLSAARARADKRALGKLKATREFWLAKEAFLLASLVRRPLSPSQISTLSLRSIMGERRPADDYNRNPIARRLMSFQEFQQAQMIRDGVLYS